MFLYSSLNSRDLCPYDVAGSIFKRDIKSTAESFKSWNTCMDNTVCKIIAIIGICLAVIVAIWLVIGILRCLCAGVGLCAAFCCCCCAAAASRRQGYSQTQNYQPGYHQGGYYPSSMPYGSRDINNSTASERNYPEYGYVGDDGDYKPGRDVEMNYQSYHHNDSRTNF